MKAHPEPSSYGPTGEMTSPNPGYDESLDRIVRRLRNSEIAALAELYDRTSAHLYGVAFRVLGDTSLAQESTYDVYSHVWRSRGRFDPAGGSALARLVALAHRHAVNRAHSMQSRSGTACIDCRSDDFDKAFDGVLHASDLSITDVPQRRSIGLVYCGAMTYREVAEHLAAAQSTVVPWIRAGLIQLRQHLDQA